ncbi:MAG: hypothetical protein P9M03_06025 [Candidatus Theseobacter exili]|nr:hypothetical protein [Candidatus Theseobacter exili]
MLPVRPGEPGKSPFWNGHARRFINVPSFDFQPVSEAVKYRFTAISDANCKYYTFEADKPWALLSPIWKDLPIGIVYLKVEGLDENENILGVAGERQFYRAASYNGPYSKPVMDYISSANKNLHLLFGQKHFQRWITENTPDSGYRLYCYPSKIIGAVIEGMVMYSGLSAENKETALLIARNAAKYLISISQPAGTPLDFFPPTYVDWNNAPSVAGKRKDQIMLFYPAIAGSAYLDLYDATKEKEFLKAAVRIADTYARIQLPSGSWPLIVNLKTGEPTQEDLCVPTDIIVFLDRLVTVYGMKKYHQNSEKAFTWIMENPIKTFHWQGQFEDVGFSHNYSNMERGKPLAFAKLLMSRSKDDPHSLEMAEELIRFAEDQFIVWERPLPREMFRTPNRPIPVRAYLTDKWLTPCALEQYHYYTPIDASAISAISAFHKAYEVTGKELYLAKAYSLANNMTVAQNLGGGIYPTNMSTAYMKQELAEYWVGWINCATMSARAILHLGNLQAEKEKF